VLQRSSIAVLAMIVAGLSLWALAGFERERVAAVPPVEPAPGRLTPRPSPQAIRALRDGARLDPNSASAADLELLPGIGPSLALRIVLDRTEHGRFHTLDELLRVRGIGPATLAKLRPLLRVGGNGIATANGPARATDPASTPATPSP
jgi:competence protein ComEA